MHLKKIKLSGFKSFVDPITIPIKEKRVAIVGPNGCGKSNIIDAVCWVMGESSAKYLRGESLTDVIFNGSNVRKPVGQASVELIFDNEDASIGGEFVNYAEISIRRSLNRNAESSWYLNGTRCRRRDIVDIFLGTGLGPRSYSIIGQNMISRLIEAKPEEMRVYLEEAAGISRYRERRRETETRIHQTRENMTRLDDIRSELERQSTTLKRQADVAEKYKVLKRQERSYRAASLATQWRQLDSQRVQYSLRIQQQETGMEAKQAEISDLTLSINQIQETQKDITNTFQVIQQRYYASGNEVTRLEQDIHHMNERYRVWQSDLQQNKHAEEIATQRLIEAHAELNKFQEELTFIQPLFDETQNDLQVQRNKTRMAEDTLHVCQQDFDTFNQQFLIANETARIQQTQIAHLEQRIVHSIDRKKVLLAEKDQLNFTLLENDFKNIDLQFKTIADQKTAHENTLNLTRTQLSQLQKTIQQKNNELHQLRQRIQQLNGQQASLNALQETALGQKNQPLSHWLKQNHLNTKKRLAETLKVEKGWERAVEKVLNLYLQAICVDNFDTLDEAFDSFKNGTLCLFATKISASSISFKNLPTLLSKIQSSWSLESLLSGVYVAETQSEARKFLKQLSSSESIITREGIWLGQNWIKILREVDPAEGIFQREQELAEIDIHLTQLTSNQKTLENELTVLSEQFEKLEHTQDEIQKKYNLSISEMARIRAQQKILEQQLIDQKNRTNKIVQACQSLDSEIESLSGELENVRTSWQVALDTLDKMADEKNKLTEKRNQLRIIFQEQRERVDETREKAHQLELQLQTIRAQEKTIQLTIVELENQKMLCLERKKALELESEQLVSIAELESQLNEALSQRVKIEEELTQARETIDAITTKLQAFEKNRYTLELSLSEAREQLHTLHLENEGLKVRANGLIEQLEAIQINLESVLAELPEDANAVFYNECFEQVVQKIARLGPINLVAIEEYATCLERKQFLDHQYNDLQSGLMTLENAITKIDRETRARFRETFDKVNNRFKELFPLVFGGGQAFLELTSDNLLETGITVMACPPGKRNSTIHLLSGGEKALTAIALVFSIFYLNPAPFCLLDEVDAPLDDANIGRFCELVKKMSEKTQFIFISHNKLAIQMAEQLVGITMAEPGVSRVVSVNVEEAMQLASV